MDDQVGRQDSSAIEMTVDLVAAYVSRNSVPVNELPALIATTHGALVNLGRVGMAAEPTPDKPTPAQVRKSITPDALISFVDGKSYKTLKRHLTGNGLTIETYRERYGLPRDYPSTAASYSAQRSELARSLGLGQQRRKAVAPESGAATDEISTEPAKKRGRPKKDAETTEVRG